MKVDPMFEHFLKERIRAFNPYHADQAMTYEDGLLLIAALRYHLATDDAECIQFIRDYLTLHILPDGTIKNYRPADFNIDNILAGNVLFAMSDLTGDPRYELAARNLRAQLESHPRTTSGSFWHKLRYPNQIWLDGLYMGQPFRLAYAFLHDESTVPGDVMNQVENVRKLLWDDQRRLYVHAYDERRDMQWADPITGRSPNVWSRSVGWFAMALADLADLFAGHDEAARKRLGTLLRELLDGMAPHRDLETGMWFQVVDHPETPGNYLETSGSAMLAYAALKGTRLGILPSSYAEDAKRTIAGIERKYLSYQKGGWVLGGICAVAGLDNERRNGSIAYYLSERIAENEIKGVGPYFFAKLEQQIY
ncbi:MAG TPA: glycosyl hydrolase family 88 [Acholeplasmatales bacterium]|nr:MAG: hypothetical protein A2Y16_02935 [Tenericutes bacterium GWF2_57_13]HAQ57364.1 glycosyl hydrolase family 88 [Acholeplasmatales bacterium]